MLTDWPFYRKSFHSLLDELQARITNEKRTFLVTANPAIMMRAYKDHNYQEKIGQADIITPDGIGVVKAFEWLGKPVHSRITGFDLMQNLFALANESRWKVYLLGTTPETVHQTKENIRQTYPEVNIAGFHHGYFETDETIIKEIQETQPDLIFVAMGCPKQETWIADHLELFRKGIFIGVGGSFDVIAGRDKRAPNRWIRHNLEWLYRIIKKPERIVLLKDLCLFLGLVLKELTIHHIKKQKPVEKVKHPL